MKRMTPVEISYYKIGKTCYTKSMMYWKNVNDIQQMLF